MLCDVLGENRDQARLVAFFVTKYPLFRVDGPITQENFEELFRAACNMIKPLPLNQARDNSGRFGCKDICNLRWSGVIRRYFLELPCGSCFVVNCGCYDEEKTFNNHNSVIRHIERHHKHNPQEVRIRAKLPENRT